MRLRPYALLAAAALGLAACDSSDPSGNGTPPPDRTPYTGEWAGTLVWVGLGNNDFIELTLDAPAATPETMTGSTYLVNADIRQPVTVTWDRQAARWSVRSTGSTPVIASGTLALTGTSLRLDYQNGLGSWTSTMPDLRTRWAGAWTGSLACASGSAFDFAWTIRAGTGGRTQLVIEETARPGVAIETASLAQNRLSGDFTTSAGQTFTYEAYYQHATDRVNLSATHVATPPDGCAGGLARP
jgi:hypothetical protein